METTNQRKYFKGLRALALTALFCTIALTLFIWGEALTPGDKSAIQSVKVSDNIQSAMKSDEPAPPVSAVTGYVVKSVRRDGKVLTDIETCLRNMAKPLAVVFYYMACRVLERQCLHKL